MIRSGPRRAFARLRTNRPLPTAGRGLVFVHVPKCGGTSVERALRRAYPIGRRQIAPDETYAAARMMLGPVPGSDDEEASRHEALMRASELRRDLLHLHLAEGARLVTGHAPLGPRTLDAVSGTHDVVTVMRGPVERMTSHLAFNRTAAAGHGRSGLAVSDMLETPRARVMGALYVKYFGGLPMDADLAAPAAIDAARRAIDRLALVGFTDAMDAFADRLATLTGKTIRIGHENRGAPKPLPPGAAARIEDLCAPDIAVYAHARERFGERRSSARGASG